MPNEFPCASSPLSALVALNSSDQLDWPVIPGTFSLHGACGEAHQQQQTLRGCGLPWASRRQELILKRRTTQTIPGSLHERKALMTTYPLTYLPIELGQALCSLMCVLARGEQQHALSTLPFHVIGPVDTRKHNSSAKL